MQLKEWVMLNEKQRKMKKNHWLTYIRQQKSFFNDIIIILDG